MDPNKSTSGDPIEDLIANNRELNQRYDELVNSLLNKSAQYMGQISILKGFVLNYLESFERQFESDERFVLFEHMQQYIEAALYMEAHLGRHNHMVRRVKEKMNELPCSI